MDKLRHRLGHELLALALGVGNTLWHQVLSPKTPMLTRRETMEMRQRFHKLLECDRENVRTGHYPRELLFQFPFFKYLRQTPSAIL